MLFKFRARKLSRIGEPTKLVSHNQQSRSLLVERSDFKQNRKELKVSER